MSIYYMNGKTFQKTFLNENPSAILKTQFILVSSRIRKNGKHENVMSCNQLLPDKRIMADYRNELDPDYFIKEYRKQLDRHKLLLAIIIKGVIEENFTIVFLCSELEWKLKYMKELVSFVEEQFQYPIYDYKKYKEGKQSIVPFDSDYVVRTCNKIIEHERKEQRRKDMKTPAGRQNIVDNMAKDEMIDELKKMHLYVKGMTKKEMREMLELFFVDRD